MKNKTNVILLMSLFIICCSWRNKKENNNYFEGIITYRVDIEISNFLIDSTLIRKAVGSTSQLFFKEGNYIETNDGGQFSKTIYRKQDNKEFTEKTGTDTSIWTDCSRTGDKILKLELNPKKEKVLGIDCDELIIYYNNRTESDYYNSDSFHINPNWFTNYVKDGENEIDLKEQAVCLKHKVEYPGFTFILSATSFSRRELDDNIFRLPFNQVMVEGKG
jgi:hypothetical protein